jgi:hypothetical protein
MTSLLGEGVQTGLAQAGFEADWVKDGIAAELALGTPGFAAVVLDLGLPRLSGLDPAAPAVRMMRAPASLIWIKPRARRPWKNCFGVPCQLSSSVGHFRAFRASPQCIGASP